MNGTLRMTSYRRTMAMEDLIKIFSHCTTFVGTVRSLFELSLICCIMLLTLGAWIVHPSSRPLASENLISLYRLDRVAASVARKDPVTGEKINKLRKSYEGKVKALQLAGKNKAISKSDEFSNMLNYPDEEWFNQKVFGKNVEDGLPASILAKLDKAVQASPGSLPAMDSNKWKSIIGADEPPTVKPADLTARKPSQGLQVLSESGSSVQNTVMSSRPLRPERTGKKRSYVDSSFKGYGEGFLDDDIVGTSAGEEDSRSSLSKKKRRKVSTEVN